MFRDITVTEAGPEEIDAIYGLAEDLIRQYENGAQVPLDEALAWTRRKIEKKIHEYRVVRYGGRKAGYFRFCREGKGMELDDLYILEPFRNRGIGSWIVERCCRSTILPVSLCVFRENTGAVALYRRLGFEIKERIDENRCLMIRKGHKTGKDENDG